MKRSKRRTTGFLAVVLAAAQKTTEVIFPDGSMYAITESRNRPEGLSFVLSDQTHTATAPSDPDPSVWLVMSGSVL